MPVLLKDLKPQYTALAMKARIEGGVLLEAVVLETGRVSTVRVLRSLDTVYGLDAEAVKALRGWLFSPGMKDGAPVEVVVTVVMHRRGFERRDDLVIDSPIGAVSAHEAQKPWVIATANVKPVPFGRAGGKAQAEFVQ